VSLKSIIVGDWRFSWRPWSYDLQGCYGVSRDEYLQAVDGRHAGCCDSIHPLVNLQWWECHKVSLPVSSHGELADCGQLCRDVRWRLEPHAGVNS
jgi:hypothetical protein